MLLSNVFERFATKTPVTVMARAAMEHALAPEALDALFDENADKQYTRDLLFSSVVDLMGVVVTKGAPSVNAAFKSVASTLPVSLASVYNKLNCLEPGITGALVAHTANRLAPVIVAMGGELKSLLPKKYRVRIIDGNHIRATQRRLDVLLGCKAGPLPGHSIVVLDPALMLATNMIPCEDGHAQERSLTPEILEIVEGDDVIVADRNFCTSKLLHGIDERDAFFVIRHHANMKLVPVGKLKRRGRTETGTVFEQDVTFIGSDKLPIKVRRVVLRLNKPTRDGDSEMSILTNLPRSAANAVAVAELYRERWTLETLFQSLTIMLEGELDTLGYPRAALFGFGIALAAYNVLSTVQAALRGKFGAEKIQTEVSAFYIANEVTAMTAGMDVAVERSQWVPFRTMTSAALGKKLLGWAARVKLQSFKRLPRGEKKPVPKRTRFAKEPHVSTARLLAAASARKKKHLETAGLRGQ